MRDVHDGEGVKLLQPRWSMSWMRGPTTRSELGREIAAHRAQSPSAAGDERDFSSLYTFLGGWIEGTRVRNIAVNDLGL